MGKASTRLTPKGRSVSRRIRRIRSTASCGVIQVRASIPSPPALATAAASSGVAADPMGACTIGNWMPNWSHNGVFSTLVSGTSAPFAVLATGFLLRPRDDGQVGKAERVVWEPSLARSQNV